MSFSIASSIGDTINFNLIETNSPEALTLNDSHSLFRTYTYGSGEGQVSNIVSITGQLTESGISRIDLYSMPQTTFKFSQNIQFTGVKYISVYNTDSTEGSDFTVCATGANACTNLFNGGSGNLLVKPQSSFSYNDQFSGFTVSTSQRYVYLNDSNGSGVSYKIFVLGLD